MEKNKRITKENHIERHKILHQHLDELVADFINHNKDKRLKNTSLMELLEWSANQCINPSCKDDECN